MNCNDKNCNPVSTDDAATPVAELPTAAPRVDAWSDQDGDRLFLDLPGVPRENVEIAIDGTTLTVVATPVTPVFEGVALHTEWRPVRYERRFELSPRSDASAVTARLDAGVLEIVVPRSAETRRRTIPVVGAERPTAE